jgi:hypothetical protein
MCGLIGALLAESDLTRVRIAATLAYNSSAVSDQPNSSGVEFGRSRAVMFRTGPFP